MRKVSAKTSSFVSRTRDKILEAGMFWNIALKSQKFERISGCSIDILRKHRRDSCFTCCGLDREFKKLRKMPRVEKVNVYFSTEIPTLSSQHLRNFFEQTLTRHQWQSKDNWSRYRFSLVRSVATVKSLWRGMFEIEHFCVWNDKLRGNLLVQVS